jgi:hypothetical protein
MFFSQGLTFIEKSLLLTLGLGLVILETSTGRTACLSLLAWHIERVRTELENAVKTAASLTISCEEAQERSYCRGLRKQASRNDQFPEAKCLVLQKLLQVQHAQCEMGRLKSR